MALRILQCPIHFLPCLIPSSKTGAMLKTLFNFIHHAMRLPSVKTLSEVFGHNAKKAREALEANRAQRMALLEELGLMKWFNQHHHPPRIHDVRMAILDKLAETCGVESIRVKDGSWCDYLNTGDTYAPTLLYFRGRYVVGDWGTIVERHGSWEGED